MAQFYKNINISTAKNHFIIIHFIYYLLSFRFTAHDKKVFQTAIAEQDQAAITGAVIAVIVVFVLCGSIVLCYNRGWACFKTRNEYNAANQGEDSPMKEMVKASEFTTIHINGTEPDTKAKDLEPATQPTNGK